MSDILYALSMVLFGVGIGFGTAWYYFLRNRLIRTEYEWYCDPVIASMYPEESKRIREVFDDK